MGTTTKTARMVAFASGTGGTAFICPCCNRMWRVMEHTPGLHMCDECSGLAPSDNQEVTPEMAAAGREIASNVVNAQVSKNMNGLGGSKTWHEWLANDVPNKDLVIAYLNDEIDSVTAIYKAMQRVKLSHGKGA